MIKLSSFGFVIFLVGLAGFIDPVLSQESQDSVFAGAVATMSIVSEVRPHGVPDNFGWPVQPLIQAAAPPAGANMFRPWLQIYETAEIDSTHLNPANVRVQYRRLCGQIYYINHNSYGGVTLYGSKLGRMYPEDYSSNTISDPVYRDESDGSVSVKFVSGSGKVFHTWTDTTGIYADDVGYVYVNFQARIIKDDASGPDNRSTSRYIASAGADWYQGSTIRGGIGVGRFKRIDSDWRTFTFTTAPTQALMNAHRGSC